MESTISAEQVEAIVRNLHHDPYFFLPQMGELDLYLFGQGDHHKIYENLGVHPNAFP